MKFKSLISIGLTSSMLAMSIPQKANSNPAILAPAICAGTAGIGCVVIGVATIGGILYYVWENTKGSRALRGVREDMLNGDYLKDPDDKYDVDSTWEDPLNTADYSEGDKICRGKAMRMGASYKVDRHPVTKRIICIFTGGTTR
jgi:hypothetical protein